MSDKLDPAVVRALADYDPESGVLTWKERPRTMFRGEKSWIRFNQHFAGKVTFKKVDRYGHMVGQIFGRDYMAHRVAWAIHYGSWPSEMIDHINGIPADNRIVNLRCVSSSGNQKNKKLARNNKSGRCGVRFDIRTGKWVAHIKSQRKMYHLGSFPDFLSACAARTDAEARFGFHENHGRVA